MCTDVRQVSHHVLPCPVKVHVEGSMIKIENNV